MTIITRINSNTSEILKFVKNNQKIFTKKKQNNHLAL